MHRSVSGSSKRARPDTDAPSPLYAEALQKAGAGWKTAVRRKKKAPPKIGSSVTQHGIDFAPKIDVAVKIVTDNSITIEKLESWKSLDQNVMRAMNVTFFF